MCGIAGIIDARRRAVPVEVLRRFEGAIAHRGPDDAGWIWDHGDAVIRGEDGGWDRLPPARCLIFHRRLSILDLTAAGRQPMSAGHLGPYLALNGEIYNYLELRQELSAEGVSFTSTSDTEVLLQALMRKGPSILDRLIGMFAFSYWDRARGRLLLARDPFGIKPLYYAVEDGRVAFASEIKALLELPWISRRLHPRAIWTYLRLGLTDAGESTCFAGIRQVPAGGSLDLDVERPEEARPVTYWDPDRAADAARPKVEGLSFEAAAEQLRHLLEGSVALHLRSDVPVGATLSGGIDSSTVVMLMRRQLGEAGRIHSFSFVPDDPRLSEAPWIEMIEGAGRVTAHRSQPRATDLHRSLRDLIRTQDQPFQSTSVFAQHQVFSSIREAGIKVVLDGQGADEILGGYPAHVAARLASLLRAGCWADALRLWREARRRPGIDGGVLWRRALASYAAGPWEGAARRLIGREAMPGWIEPRWFQERGVEPGARDFGLAPGSLREQQVSSLTRTMLPALLRYEDRNSMAHGVEGRVPFLTPEIAGFALALPEEYHIGPDGETKRLLRRAMRGIVPDGILDRRDKIGFVTPQTDWLVQLAPWVEEMLASPRLRSLGMLRPERLRLMWEETRGRPSGFDSRVWRWLNLVEWADVFDLQD